MDARSVKTAKDARQIVEERGLKHVKVGVFDIDGVLRGKFMAKDKFFSASEKGFGFCDVVLGWDCNDQLYDNVKVIDWHTDYPDGLVEIDSATCRELPDGDGLLCIGNDVGPHGRSVPQPQFKSVGFGLGSRSAPSATNSTHAVGCRLYSGTQRSARRRFDQRSHCWYQSHYTQCSRL